MEWKVKGILLSCCIIFFTGGSIIQFESEHEGNLSFPLVTLSFNKSLNIKEGTFCLKFYLFTLGKYNLFSTTFGRKTFSLFFAFDENYGFFFLQNRKSTLFSMSNVWPFEWFHFCFTYKNDGFYAVTNGKILDSKAVTVNDDNSEYHFIEKLTIGSLVNGPEIFSGRISGLNIWDHLMTIDELKIITTSCTELQKQPNILKWSRVNEKQLLIGNKNHTKHINENEGMCSTENKVKVALYVALLDYENAKHICDIWNGEIYLPKTKEEFIKMHNDSSTNHDYKQCDYVLLPIYYNDQGHWEDNFGQTLTSTQLKWADGEPNGNGKQRCVVADINYDFYDTFCSSKRCPICKWIKNPVFYLKGLCPKSNIEHRYVLRINERYQGYLAFKGFSNDYYIVFDINQQRYVLVKSIKLDGRISPINDNIIGVSFAESNAMPIGLQTWEINDGKCNQTAQLKLTSV